MQPGVGGGVGEQPDWSAAKVDIGRDFAAAQFVLGDGRLIGAKIGRDAQDLEDSAAR